VVAVAFSAANAKCKVSRTSRILEHINVDGRGIEIGPCHSPVAPKRKGFRVETIDHLDKEGLLRKYAGQKINTDNIEEVDFVWRGESYAELTGRQHYYDWVIASHVIEHTPDLVAFINQCDDILAQEGVLSLVVPDKRYCFDKYRPISSLAHVVDRHLSGAVQHSPGAVAEYYLNVVRCDGEDAWDASTTGQYTFSHPSEAGLKNYSAALGAGEWLDVHAWCFVPHSFRLLIQDLYGLGLIKLKELSFHSTVGCEFYMTLSREGAGMPMSRMAMLQEVELELMGHSQGIPASRLKKLAKKCLRLMS